MKQARRRYLFFLGLGSLAGVVATLGFEVLAAITLGGEKLGAALSVCVSAIKAGPLSALLLLAPFPLLGWMSAALMGKRGFEKGLIFFLVTIIVLGVINFLTYRHAQIMLNQQAWTAAGLSVGFLFFKSLLFLLLCLTVWAGIVKDNAGKL